MPQHDVDRPTLWVDADACPRAIRDVLFRAADRREVRVVLVANQFLRKPPSAFVSVVQVESGFDVADRTIVERLQPGDLVITADIPLADEVIAKGGTALTPRGMLYTRENIKDHLSRRDMLDELRSSGVITGGPPSLDKRDVQAFANGLDRFLTRALAGSPAARPEAP
ncbi:MAG: YaiI/YqxD family protein [Pseudomonadales bacterium]